MESREFLKWPENKVPDYMEPLIGWRFWFINEEENRVVSRSEEWEPFKAHKAIHKDWWANHLGISNNTSCHPLCAECGIYAYKEKIGVENHTRFMVPPVIIGQVYLWGEVVEHKVGYRAQYAYPKSFYGGPIAKKLAEIYKVEHLKGEDTCILAKKLDDTMWNPWFIPSPSQIIFQNKYLSNPIVQIPSLPEKWTSPWKSRSILNPENEKGLIKKIEIGLKQPSFNIHKPTTWWKDNQSGLWLRTEMIER